MWTDSSFAGAAPARHSPSAVRPAGRPRVLWVINSLTGGGAERVFTSLLTASRQYSDRYEISVALLDDDAEAYRLPAEFQVHRLGCGHSLVRSLIRLARLVRETDPDVTVSFLTRSNLATAAAMSWRGRPFILSERVNTTAHLSTGRFGRASRAMVALAYPRAERVIAVSEGVAGTLVHDYAVAPERVRVFPNPVDVEAIGNQGRLEPGIAVSRGDVVAMGRLVENKNFALAIRAFARSRRTGRLLLLGEGSLRGRLRALGDELGLGDRLVMPGFVANPYAVVARCDFLILSSNAEGFSNALVEAMACGVPVLATDCPSSPAEILNVEDRPAAGAVAGGEGGLLVPANDEEAMAAAIVRLGDPAARSALASLGLNRVKAFDVSTAVERYWSVIAEALPAASRPSVESD